MLYKVHFDDKDNIVLDHRVDHLWISETEWNGYHELFNKGIKEVHSVTSYLWETKESAIRWAHYCLKNVKDKIKVEEIKDKQGKIYRIEYYYLHEGEKYRIAITHETGLIIDECHNEDW